MTQTSIPYMQIRGGSSKGLYFRREDLPDSTADIDRLLIAAMCGVGGHDRRQIDGLGGADPLTSKVAIINVSERADADLDYEFVQVVVGNNSTDRTQNCGNILAGVVPFALEAGLLQSTPGEFRARIYMVNSDAVCEVVVRTDAQGAITYSGETKIDGVPGTAAPVICQYKDLAGSACGSLFPTGNRLDEIDNVQLTAIDNGMPVVLLRARDMGVRSYESRDELNRDEALKAKLESIRLQIGPRMNLGDVSDKVVPKMCLIAEARQGGLIETRTFIPHVCHAAIGVLGAVSVATACLIPGTVAEGLVPEESAGNNYSIEHPSGEFSVQLEIDLSGEQPDVKSAGLLRTARLLAKGQVFIPDSIQSSER